jgi:quercetin dioxygenase-like cupin family protein
MSIEAIHPADYNVPSLPHIRIRWTPESTDLHLNLVDLRAGEEISEHVNTALDVILTCLDGSGTLLVDGKRIDLTPGSIAMITKGLRRAIIAGDRGMRYTTCHQKRGGLIPTISSKDGR